MPWRRSICMYWYFSQCIICILNTVHVLIQINRRFGAKSVSISTWGSAILVFSARFSLELLLFSSIGSFSIYYFTSTFQIAIKANHKSGKTCRSAYYDNRIFCSPPHNSTLWYINAVLTRYHCTCKNIMSQGHTNTEGKAKKYCAVTINISLSTTSESIHKII